MIWGFVTSICLSSTFENKFSIDSWCSNSKSFNHISDQVFKCLSGPLMCFLISDLYWQVRMRCDIPLCLCSNFHCAALTIKLNWFLRKFSKCDHSLVFDLLSIIKIPLETLIYENLIVLNQIWRSLFSIFMVQKRQNRWKLTAGKLRIDFIQVLSSISFIELSIQRWCLKLQEPQVNSFLLLPFLMVQTWRKWSKWY